MQFFSHQNLISILCCININYSIISAKKIKNEKILISKFFFFCLFKLCDVFVRRDEI